jgi:hypothetical protein
LKVEIFPRAEADMVRQFRYYLVDQDAPATAFRFREAVIESVEQLMLHPYTRFVVSRFDPQPSLLAGEGFRRDSHLLR